MKRFSRMFFVWFLTALLVFSAVLPASGADASARLYNIYGDEMLFRQNTDAVFAGTGTPGAAVRAELINGGAAEAFGESVIAPDGTFTVSFPAPAGSYTEYTVKLYVNGTEFRQLRGVVFGELWLASGQSNMQYDLGNSIEGLAMAAAGETGSKWLRVFSVPPITEFDGASGSAPVDPQEDIRGCFWFSGDSAYVYTMSAAAYFFGEKLAQDLDIPVGILNASLGGSAIRSWLSRDAIDSDAAVRSDLMNAGEYVTESEWNNDGQNQYFDMGANYNLKIYPMRRFRPSGMIWYQGETDVAKAHGYYSRLFDLMQRSYTEEFSHTDGLFPIVYTQLASYSYADIREPVLQNKNLEFTAMQQARPESRAMITMYDVPLDYTDVMGSIHPGYKQPIGERMETAAMGLLYEPADTYTAANIAGSEIRDGSVYVTLNNTGTGLTLNGAKAKDFAVCGEDGIYVRADAEIVSADTVRVYSSSVAEPAAASYGYSLMNGGANLCAADEDGNLIPAAPFVTAVTGNEHFYTDAAWTNCDTAKVWHTCDTCAYYDVWTASRCETAFSEDGMNVTSGSSSFSVSPVLSYKEKMNTIFFDDTDYDFSDYGTLTLTVKNNGGAKVKLDEIRLYTSSVLWFTPECAETGDPGYTVKADGETYTVAFDLNRLCLDSNEGSALYTNNKLSDVKNIRFAFSCEGNADITIENITFTPETEAPDGNFRFEKNMGAADTLFELFCSFFSSVFARITAIFAPFVKDC